MNIEQLSHHFSVRRLQEADVPAVYTLCAGNPQYYEHCPPAVTPDEVRRDMAALPEGKSAADKYFLGFWQGARLTAVMDLIDSYPDAETAYIGFFMTEQETQGAGLATALVAEICAHLKEEGFAWVRLAYAAGNPQSERFWLKNGFQKTGIEKQMEGYRAVAMERAL